MEGGYRAIKDFVLGAVNGRLPEYSDEEITLAAFTESGIVFGAVDLQKNSKNLVCAVLPESQGEEDGTISDYRSRSRFTVAFIVRGDAYARLVKKMCRYAECFRKCVLSDCTLSGAVADVELGDRQFFYDAGTVEKQACAVEVEVTIMTDESL